MDLIGKVWGKLWLQIDEKVGNEQIAPIDVMKDGQDSIVTNSV